MALSEEARSLIFITVTVFIAQSLANFLCWLLKKAWESFSATGKINSGIEWLEGLRELIAWAKALDKDGTHLSPEAQKYLGNFDMHCLICLFLLKTLREQRDERFLPSWSSQDTAYLADAFQRLEMLKSREHEVTTELERIAKRP